MYEGLSALTHLSLERLLAYCRYYSKVMVLAFLQEM